MAVDRTGSSVREFVKGVPRQLIVGIHDIGVGIGQGTWLHRRRAPRTKVDDISIAEASGMTLGEDHNYHPLESDSDGRLRVRAMDEKALLEELVILQRATLVGMAQLQQVPTKELLEEATNWPHGAF